MPALSDEQIAALLKLDKTSEPSRPAISKHKPVQIGPLCYMEKDDKCVSSRCGSPCRIRVKGIPYCNTHALYALNELYMKLDGTYEKLRVDECVCNAGRHSKLNVHTADCPIYQRVKDDDNSTNSSSNTITTSSTTS